MDTISTTPLQVRELFHLEFLRRFGRELKSDTFALKGGANLRFYFDSPRYSEDMDIDVSEVPFIRLQDAVMGVVSAKTFLNTMETYGIERVVAPDIQKAKQTETTQRFKIHLITLDGLDLFTKVEFSRRGFTGETIVEEISEKILRFYRMSPFLVPHYPAQVAIEQKIGALAGRAAVQARDVFDLYFLRPHFSGESLNVSTEVIKKARENMFSIEFKQFKDTVVEYLSPEERQAWETRDSFDEIRLQVDALFEHNEARRK
jgi:hypothetical protein